MTLKREMVSSGHWLFRYRGSFPVLFVVLLLVAVFTGSREVSHPAGITAWEAFCLLIAISGLVVRGVTLGFVSPGTSGRNTTAQRADELNTTGIYSMVRHPLYLANWLCWLGVLLVPGIWWLPLTVTLGFWLYYERIMMAEEDFLQGKFGEPYLEWAGRTPPFLPRFSSWKPSSRRFSLKFVLKREYASWLGVITSFVLLELVLHWASEEGGMPGRFWLILEGVALVFYLIMRILRTRTRLLHQSDR
ncbi:MAG: DUF1295 domain-containing protein [Calditrichaeota bacterium]|nr:DUF1295 domain-containing protein [Calditrichota bacterium]MCB9473829.1 DUF1295 domain-containing protein [Candidatus Delongbacteria bacterium]